MLNYTLQRTELRTSDVLCAEDSPIMHGLVERNLEVRNHYITEESTAHNFV